MIGSYVAYFAHVGLGLSPLLAILIAALTDFIAGVLAEKTLIYPLRRLSKEKWVMNTFLIMAGLSCILQNLALIIGGVKYRGITEYWKGSIQITPHMSISVDRAVAFLIMVVAIVTFWVFLHRTGTGRAIRAVSQDERGAVLVGINPDRIYALTFGLGSMLAGLAGASLLFLIPAYPFAGVKPQLGSWLVVTIMGLGNVGGATVGGFIVGMLESISYRVFGQGWQEVMSLCMLVLILLLKPSGLFGTEVKGRLEE